MKRILINTLKKHRWVYVIYYYTFNTLLKVLGLFLKANKKEVLIVCYGGLQYGDNMKPVYERLLKDSRFNEWRFVWAFRNPDIFILPDENRTIKCKIDTLSFYYHALRSRCWLTNVSVQRGLNFKNRGTYYINTWHGVPLKYIGLDIKEGSSFRVLSGVEDFDLICTMGSYDVNIAKSAFGVDENCVKITGYPRNDIIFEENIEVVRERVKKKLDVDFSKKVVLYAPTYRDYCKDKLGNFYFESTLSADKFRQVLGDEYILVVRAHGAIANSNLDEYIDASSYPDVEDLLRIADYLVTDYSGIMFDYSLLEKPTVCFSYDLDKYEEKRGMYVNYREFMPFPICMTEEEVYSEIGNMDYKEGCKRAKLFVEKCGLVKKDASQNVVDVIYEGLKK